MSNHLDFCKFGRTVKELRYLTDDQYGEPSGFFLIKEVNIA